MPSPVEWEAESKSSPIEWLPPFQSRVTAKSPLPVQSAESSSSLTCLEAFTPSTCKNRVGYLHQSTLQVCRPMPLAASQAQIGGSEHLQSKAVWVLCGRVESKLVEGSACSPRRGRLVPKSSPNQVEGCSYSGSPRRGRLVPKSSPNQVEGCSYSGSPCLLYTSPSPRDA